MAAIVSCPECRRALEVPEDYFGQTVRCPDCKHTFEAQPPEAAIQIGPASSAPARPAPVAKKPARYERVDEDEDEDEEDFEDDLEDLRRGRRSGRRSGAGRPDRGGVILALGIVSLVLSFVSFSLYFLPIWLLPMAAGIVGWVMGQRDLRAMREGTMDASNQVMTLVGMILSIVGLCLSLCVMILSCAVMGFLGVLLCGAAANG
jgi:hypothetical protein